MKLNSYKEELLSAREDELPTSAATQQKPGVSLKGSRNSAEMAFKLLPPMGESLWSWDCV